MLDMISNFLTTVDDFVWGIPLIVLILATGLFLTARLHFLQITKLPHAIKHLIANEKSGEDGDGTGEGGENPPEESARTI